MAHYYLRMEATNFDHFISDTQDLSTIRGGGLLLLRAAERLKEERPELEIETVTTGASDGLFAFAAESDKAARKVRDDVARHLRQHSLLRYGTFVVDITPVGKPEDFQRDLETLRALGRWRQMASPSLAVPSIPDGSGQVEPCGENRVLPARDRVTGGGTDRRKVCESVWLRRGHGRDKKQAFYFQETRIDVEAGYSQSFEELAQGPPAGDINRNLHGKMAVVYVDGNDFGKVLRRHGDTEEKLRKLDEALREQRRGILRGIVERARDLPALREGRTGDGPIRLETLLWGGDEIVWVVPAWAGWWLVQRFYRHPWSRPEKLTHACGIVFCQHKAPIHRMRRLAEELAGLAKTKSRTQDLVAYEVLESYDRLGSDLESYRRSRCPPSAGGDASCLLLEPARIAEASRIFGALRRHLPSRQVLAAARAALKGTLDEKTDGDELAAALPTEEREKLNELLSKLGAFPGVAWVHLAALWDYLEPLEDSADA